MAICRCAARFSQSDYEPGTEASAPQNPLLVRHPTASPRAGTAPTRGQSTQGSAEGWPNGVRVRLGRLAFLVRRCDALRSHAHPATISMPLPTTVACFVSVVPL